MLQSRERNTGLNVMQALLGHAWGTEPCSLPSGRSRLLVQMVSPEPLAPARLARALPASAAQRNEARQEYLQLLQLYRQSVSAIGLPWECLGVALGIFVCGNYAVAAGVSLNERQVAGTIAYSQHLLSGRAQLLALNAFDRQELLEEVAILGMLMQAIYGQHEAGADPAALLRARPAASRYLQDVLGIPVSMLCTQPDGIRLCAQGRAVSTHADASARGCVASRIG